MKASCRGAGVVGKLGVKRHSGERDQPPPATRDTGTG